MNPTTSDTPIMDDAWDAFDRKSCGMAYVRQKSREVELKLHLASANYALAHGNLGREVVKCGQLASDNKNLMSEIRTLQDALSNLRNWCELNGWDISTTNRAQTIANQELAQERGEESDAATETANRGRAV